MSVLVNENNLIPIQIRYYDDGNYITAFEDKEQEQEWIEKEKKRRRKMVEYFEEDGKEIPDFLLKDPSEDIKTINTKWKRMSWGVQDEIYDSCLTSDSEGRERIDLMKYNKEVVNKLMAQWDLKDAEGNIIPIVPEIISRLDPEIGRVLVTKFNSGAYNDYPDDKELENLE